MTKKEFKELASVHMYGKRSNGMIAIYYDWKQGEIDGNIFVGFKYAIFTRQGNITQVKLLKLFYELIFEVSEVDLPYYVTFVKVSDINRFKVPITSNGLNHLDNIYNEAENHY